MERNSELQDIARQLRELSARLEALIAEEEVPMEAPAPVEESAADEEAVADDVLVEVEAEAEVEPEAEPEAEPVEAEEVANTSEKCALPISLNDRYRFQREIFGGSAQALSAALELLASMTSPGEVEDYFAAHDFDLEADAVKDFLRLATRRFDSHPPLIV